MKFLRLINVIVFTSITTVSCNISQDLAGKSFNSYQKHRRVQLIFDNDSICRFKNTFNCNDIDPKFREITIICRYEKVDKMLILKNIDCKSDSCKKSFTIDIPPQKSTQCDFLNEDKRTRVFTIGPNYPTAYERYGLVPNIDIDTVFIVKNKLLFIKNKQNWGSIGFILK